MLSASIAGAFAEKVPAALLPAGNNRVSVRVSNTSSGVESGPISVTLFVSSTPAVGSDAVIVGTATRSVRMRPGRAANFPFRFEALPPLPVGSDFLVAKIAGPATPDGSPNESIVVAPQTVSVAEPFVDLTGQVSAPAAPVFVGSFGATCDRAQVRVTNSGNAPARGSMQITLYASTGAALDASAVVVGVATIPTVRIPPGGSRVFAVNLTIPAGTAVRSYTLFASINSSHTIAESNFANNTAVAAKPLVLTDTPPAVIDTRGHHHHDGGVDTGAGAAVFVGGSTLADYAVPVDSNSGVDQSAPPADSGNGADFSSPTTAPTDSGSSPGPSFDATGAGSDFGGSFSDLGGGADF